MPTTLTLAVMARLRLPVQAVKQPPTAPPSSLDDPADLAQGADLMREV